MKLAHVAQGLRCFVIQLAVLILVSSLGYGQNRSSDIRRYISEVEGPDPIAAAIAADQALRSSDPLLRSIVLGKALENKDPRVRSIGFTYLIKTQKRLVVEATATEAALSSIASQNDQKSLKDQLVLVLEFSDFDPNTSRFTVRASKWGKGEGAIGQDGITITVYHNKLTLRSALSGYLVGTASYKLGNTYGLVHLPAKAALP